MAIAEVAGAHLLDGIAALERIFQGEPYELPDEPLHIHSLVHAGLIVELDGILLGESAPTRDYGTRFLVGKVGTLYHDLLLGGEFKAGEPQLGTSRLLNHKISIQGDQVMLAGAAVLAPWIGIGDELPVSSSEY